MRFTQTLLTLILALAGAAHWSATSAETITAGGACHSITPSQASLMEWREEGIKNSSSTDYWVLCPIQRSAGSGEKEFSLRVFNESNASLSLQCYFREIFDNRRLQAKSVAADLNSGGSESLSWVMTPEEAKSVVNVACKLPNGLLIEAITSGSSGTSDNTGGGPNDVYACVTSPDNTYYSSTDIVTMKNGMRLNNYDGRSWGTGDDHVVFKTPSGKWYTLGERSEVYRLDVLSEPQSCFEPDFYEVTNRYAGGDYGYILETTGGNAQIEEGCGINVGAQVYSFVALYTSQYYLLDLLTSNNCKTWAP